MIHLKNSDYLKLWCGIFGVFFIMVPLCTVDAVLHVALIGVILCAVIGYKLRLKNYPLFIFMVAFILRLIVVGLIETPPSNDFGRLYSISQRVLEGDWNFVNEKFAGIMYFKVWSYQLGWVVFQSMLLRIWNSILSLQIINCLCGAATSLLVYLFARKFAGEKAAQVVSLLYCFSPFALTYVTVLTNQFAYTLIVFFGLYLIITEKDDRNNWSRYAVAALLFAIADFIRPEGIVPVFVVAFWLILTISKTNYKFKLQYTAILVGIYFVLKRIISFIFILTGIAENGLGTTNPYWKFLLGFNTQSNGGWNAEDFAVIENNEICKELMLERLTQPIADTLNLFLKKIEIFWAGGNTWWSLDYTAQNGISLFGKTFYVPEIHLVLDDVMGCVATVTYILVVLGVVSILRRKNFNNKVVLLVNYVFVNLGVYLLIEVQERYVYSVQVAVFILAALGLEYIVNGIHDFRRKRTKVEGK